MLNLLESKTKILLIIVIYLIIIIIIVVVVVIIIVIIIIIINSMFDPFFEVIKKRFLIIFLSKEMSI